MEPSSILATIAGAFFSKLEHPTLFAVALIVFIWWVYKESVWKWVKG